jgi:hypothetical protein
MFLAEHYNGYLGPFKVPELLFFIGPSKDNPLKTEEDYQRREDEVRCLLNADHENFARLEVALLHAFGAATDRLLAEVRQGGWKGTICPNLCINTGRSTFVKGDTLYSAVTREVAEDLGRSLMTILGAEWVACWHWPYNAFQLEFKRDSPVGITRGDSER